jgi:hypothetical protein
VEPLHIAEVFALVGSVAIILAAAAATGANPALVLPDIAVHANVRAREVRIDQQGEARLRIWAEPSAHDSVKVERNLPKGQRRYRNLEIRLDAEARLAALAERAAGQQSPAGER